MFVASQAWEQLSSAHTTAAKAEAKAEHAEDKVAEVDARVDLVDARQKRTEDLYEQQIQMNERLYDLQLHDRGMTAPRSQPTRTYPATPIPGR